MQEGCSSLGFSYTVPWNAVVCLPFEIFCPSMLVCRTSPGDHHIRFSELAGLWVRLGLAASLKALTSSGKNLGGKS
jgi:hypothetical protein